MCEPILPSVLPLRLEGFPLPPMSLQAQVNNGRCDTISIPCYPTLPVVTCVCCAFAEPFAINRRTSFPSLSLSRANSNPYLVLVLLSSFLVSILRLATPPPPVMLNGLPNEIYQRHPSHRRSLLDHQSHHFTFRPFVYHHRRQFILARPSFDLIICIQNGLFFVTEDLLML